MALPYPPPYQDLDTLSQHTTLAPRTIEMWVKSGRLPEPKVRDGKRLWKWKEVERYLDGAAGTVPSSPDAEAERIRDGTRKALAGSAG
jgi:hypothetical protein